MKTNSAVEVCELCNGSGYFKSNTAEYEGECPNGCKEPETTCDNCGQKITEGKYCESCREVFSAVQQLDERFARQEGL